jgi:hypothetical protein
MSVYLIALRSTCRGIIKGRVYTQLDRWSCPCNEVRSFDHTHGPVVRVAECHGGWHAWCRKCKVAAPNSGWHPLFIFRELNDPSLDEVPEQYADGTPRERERAGVRELERILREA